MYILLAPPEAKQPFHFTFRTFLSVNENREENQKNIIEIFAEKNNETIIFLFFLHLRPKVSDNPLISTIPVWKTRRAVNRREHRRLFVLINYLFSNFTASERNYLLPSNFKFYVRKLHFKFSILSLSFRFLPGCRRAGECKI